jgi:hypothetical protein
VFDAGHPADLRRCAATLRPALDKNFLPLRDESVAKIRAILDLENTHKFIPYLPFGN